MTSVSIRDEFQWHEPGIYFGMSEAEYLADPSLSNSGIKNLLVSPLTYWVNSPLNPEREPEETDATSTGKAFHKRILEGAEAFHATYAQALDPADYPKALKSGDQLRSYCKELVLKPSGTLAEMSARIREVDAVVQLWTEIEAEYLQTHAGKEFLPKRVISQIELAASTVEANPATAALFTGGFPEVSIFWVDQATGVRMKARLDYLTLEVIPDLKTFSNSQGKPLGLAVTTAMASYGYGVQAVVYLDAISQFKRLFRELGMEAVHIGESLLNAAFDFEAWLKRLVKAPDHRFVFMFQETGRVPNVAIREFNRNTNFYDICRFQYEAGQAAYRAAVERWGYGQPWVEPAEIVTLEDEDFPLWAFK